VATPGISQNKSEREFTEKWNNWRKAYMKEFEAKSQEWQEEYLEFVTDKSTWVKDMTVASTQIGSNLNTLNDETSTAITTAMESAVTDILIASEEDPNSIANRLMNNGLFAQLSDAGSKLLGTVGENRFAFNTALRRTGFDSAGAMKDFKDYQQVQNEEMKNRLAALQLEKMIDSFQARIDGIALRVDDTNDYWDEYTEDSLTAAGFRREGTTFQKDIVTGSTITSPVIRELREIQQYQDMLYETPDLETASGIRNYGLVYDFDAVQALIANATKVVEAEEERVFGTGVREWRAEGGAWAERDEAPDLSKKKEQEKGWQNRGDGLFGKHVGYAPVYKSGYDVDMEKSRTKNIKYKGSGELGRILGYLSWYNMEEGAGYSQVNQPAWDKPLWDTFEIIPGWEMEAPSFAGAVDLVVQVVATVATAPVGGWGGAALGAAIGSVDDLLFTALELGTGYIIPEQALLQVGQTLLKAGVQFAAQGAFQGYEKQAGGLMAAWGKNFMGEATVNFLQQLTTNTLNGAIDAVELSYDDDGNLEGLGFDMERWGESVYGVRALAGYAGSFARSATQSLLKGTAVGFLGEGANNYNALIKTASALAGEGVGSLIDGEFSINVLNLTDILSPFIEDKDLLAKMDMGLFSMNFARDKNGNLKTTSRINSAGANVGGLVGLARSVAGLTEAYDNIRIGLSGADEKTAIALRGISSNGQEKSANLFEEILSGKTTLQEAFDVAVGQLAETTRTELGKQIGVDLASLNGFELGVVLAHEAMRNGRNDGEEGQRLETIDAVLAHSDHAMQVLEKYGLGALGYQMVQEAIDYAKMQNGEISQEDFEAYVDGKYDSTEDFWKLTKDGKLVYDGDGWLKNEDGEYILSDGRFVKPEELTEEDKALRLGDKLIEKGLKKILGLDGQKVNDRDYGQRVAQLLITDYAKMTLADDGTWINDDNENKGFALADAVNAIMSHRDFGGRSMRGYPYPRDENIAMFNRHLTDEQKDLLLHDESYYRYTNFSTVPLAHISGLLHQFSDEFTNGDVFSNLLTRIDNEIADNQRIIGYRREYYEAMGFIPSEVAMEEQNNQLERLLENSSLSERTKHAYRDALSYSFEEPNLKGASADSEFVRGLPREAGVATDVTWCVGGVENFYGAMYPESDALYKLAQHPMPGWMNMQNTIDSGIAAGMPVFTDVELALSLVNAGGSVIMITDGAPAHGNVLVPQDFNGQSVSDLTVINVGQRNGLMDAQAAFTQTYIPRVRFMWLMNDTSLYYWNQYFGVEDY
jgi:hypothetical protein